ncbi:glutathione S-transferase [Candidatus Symbiopectobacterium sp.]|uniref:glutathione S-transferase n=1 Tax=Candidatus Symbiopectobacterium sp. TaxID=2816440 RepID=UPI0025C5F850|nr:glutathione S-transferase [Candidatus Symbiopectobacterium sp.]
MLTLWGRENSSNVKKVRWLAAELGLSYQHIPAGGQFGRNREADYLTMNPNVLIPCLQDDDLVLWESNTIVRCLADHGQRTNAEKWMDWEISLAVPFGTVFIGLVRTAPEQRDVSLIAKQKAECERLLAIADDALIRQPWLSGPAFGIGDIPLGCIAYCWFNMDIERPSLPHLERWY